MTELKWYNHPKEFLDACAPLLEIQELAHNVILGNCYNVIADNRSLEGCYFLSASEGNAISGVSIKLSPKVMLACKNSSSVEAIWQFYLKNSIPVKGVIGDVASAEHVAAISGKRLLRKRRTLVQGLSKVNDLHLAAGTFEPPKLSDLPLLKKWVQRFFDDEQLLPKRTRGEIEQFVKMLMMQGSLFCWRQAGEPVSMAAIIRKTKHTAIIGLVYTPEQHRGKGFGRSCVHQLSEYILRSGFRESGLLVYDDNAVARKIYGQMGYVTVSQMLDIDFD